MNAGNHSQRSSAAWRRPLIFAVYMATVIGIGTALTGQPAQSAARSACWTDRFSLGLDGFAGPITTVGMRAYVAGAGSFMASPSSRAAVRIRAYNLAGRRIAWIDNWTPSPFDNSPVGIAHVRHVVVVAARTGLNTLQAEFHSLALRAFAGGNGHVLWEDRCAGELPGPPSSGPPYGPHDALLAFGNDVVVAGNCDPNETGNVNGLLRS